jgi:FKBP-type peptidyl-prolyl cis-trans isomerase FklB
MKLVALFSLFAALGMASCGEQDPHRPINEAEMREHLLDYNRTKVHEEDSLIERFMRKHELQWTKSSTGMRFSIVEEGLGLFPKAEDQVQVRYTMHLLDSTFCYSNVNEAPYVFIVNGSDVAPGFHEMVQLLKPGGKAQAVWPARLGFGLAGDFEKIPQDAVLLVDLELE